MAQNLHDLLTILNTANLQKDNPRLYDFLRRFLEGTQQVNTQVTTIASGGGGGGGFVTSAIGGTPSTIAMFTAVRNIENVTLAGISAALDLL